MNYKVSRISAISFGRVICGTASLMLLPLVALSQRETGSNLVRPALAERRVALSALSAVSQRTHLLGEYLLDQGFGTVAADTSGKSRDGMIRGGPTWVQNQGLDFRVAGQYIDLPPSANPVQSWQMAVYNPPYSSRIDHVGQAPVYSGFGSNPTLLCGSAAVNPCFLQSSYVTGSSSRFYALTDHTEAASFLSAGWHVVTFVCGTASNPAHIFYDAAEVSSYVVQGTNTCPVATGGNLQIAGSTYYQAFWTGRVAAAWLWDVPLSVADAQASAQAGLDLLTQRGIPLPYPNVQATTPLVIAGLDSRTAGAGAGLTDQTMWPSEMHLSDPTYQVINVARGGQTVYDEINQFNILYGLQYQPNTVPVIIVLWGGVNDFQFQTPQQIADNLHLAVQKAKAAGARIILSTEISSNGHDVARDQLNTILRAQALGWGADNLAELATDPILGADGASTNTAYFADGLHPNAAAEPHITAIMQNAVNELIGSSTTALSTSNAGSYQEQASDDYLRLTGTANQNVTLPDCTGYALPRSVTAGPGGANVTAYSGQSLSGTGMIAPNLIGQFTPIPGSAQTAGCSWQRTYSITGQARNAEQVGEGLNTATGSILPISVLFSYTGPVPVGQISVNVDGSNAALSGLTCVLKGQDTAALRNNCTVSFSAPTIAGSHTLTFSQGADGTYAAYTGTATITVVP